MLQWWTHWAEYYRHAVAAAIADDPADLLNNDNYNDLDNNCLDNSNPEFEVVGPDPEFFEAVDPDPELFEADPDPGFFEVVYDVGDVLHSCSHRDRSAPQHGEAMSEADKYTK